MKSTNCPVVSDRFKSICPQRRASGCDPQAIKMILDFADLPLPIPMGLESMKSKHGERHNLAIGHQERVKEMQAMLEKIRVTRYPAMKAL